MPDSRPTAEPSKRPSVRAVAFFLPQFHPIPENNEWWSPGFTEWTNVARAQPLYPGHDQPHIPADLGFYDLRIPEVRAAQAELAACHGVEAFCYWRYWFNGRQVLERPFQEVLSSGQPRFGFCLAWANENWTGIWTGDRSRVLIEQTYPGHDDYTRHFLDVLPAFRDDRYFRVNDRPLFFVHRPHLIPDPGGFTTHWRELAEQHGLDGLYLVAEAVGGWRPVEHGFDAEVRTPLAFLLERPWPLEKLTGISRTLRRGPLLYPYRVLARHPRPAARSPQPELPMVLPNWDNTPRSGRRGFVLRGSTPDRFRRALSTAVASVQTLPPDERIVFLKSWNEWAEGNYLEPDLRYGDRYLRAVSDVVLEAAPGSSIPSIR
jgi:lipopolysaccharide biosynthesis protein